MIDLDGFRAYFIDVMGAKDTTFPSYRSYLRRIDELAGGLDEKYEELGFEGLIAWAKIQTEGPFEKKAGDARSVLKSYLGFKTYGSTADASANEIAPNVAAAETTIFKLEKEMQKAVRADLSSLEAGLVAIDDGMEATVVFDASIGRIDILARDAKGMLVVIELKAGQCPSGAIEQTLSYAQAIAEEKEEPVRAILIAGSFKDRHIFAARRINDLVLKIYSYKMSYGEVPS